MTPARVAILRLLRTATEPLSHLDVVAQLGPLGRDRTTIYRNLKQLTKARLLRRILIGVRLYRFVAIDDETKDGRIATARFVCSVCGAIQQLTEIELATTTSSPRALRLGRVQIDIQGRCDRCL